MRKPWRIPPGALVWPLLAGALGLAFSLGAPNFPQRVELAVFDLFQVWSAPPPSQAKIVVVLAGERSFQARPAWPWPRRLHAELLGQLDLARLVALDILFPEPSQPEDDALLAAVVQAHGRVVLAAQLNHDEYGAHTLLTPPYPALARAAAALGLANIEPGPDGLHRDYRLLWPLESAAVPSLPLAIYQVLAGAFPPLEEDNRGYTAELPGGPARFDQKFNFKVRPPAREVPIYEYIDVLEGLVPPREFENAVIIVGISAAGAGDLLSTARGRVLPGSVYVAHAVETLLSGEIVAPPNPLAGHLAAALLALAAAALGRMRGVKWSGLWLMLLLFAWGGLSFALFKWALIWLPPVKPFLLGLAAFGLAAGLSYRFMSDEWRAYQLSLETILFLGRKDFDPNYVSFADYLRQHWPEVEAWSGVALLNPGAEADAPEIKEALAHLEKRQVLAGPLNLEASVIAARSGIHRLLLGLPAMENHVRSYVILGWSGRRSRETLKGVAAVVLSAALYFKALEERNARSELFLGVIRLIMSAVDAKDPTTAGHSERVAGLARELAEKLGLPPEEVDDIYLSWLLHDVGKIGIPDHILNKPGRLTEEEMAAMRRHPSLGAEMMRKINLSETVIRGIIEHHERLDGRGYPHGLAENSVSRVGRILKIVDVYDALISRRQYKEALGPEEVYKILKEGAGSDFDEELTALLLDGDASFKTS